MSDSPQTSDARLMVRPDSEGSIRYRRDDDVIAPLELTTENDIALRIDAVNLKNRLRDVETDCRNLSHDLAPPNRGSLNSAHIQGTHVPGGGAVHSINKVDSRDFFALVGGQKLK
jgi:hypothetical protein